MNPSEGQESTTLKTPEPSTPSPVKQRNAPANKARTPATTPNRQRTRKEPTLLQDFLLGRPSVNRSRRRSLDVVKKELREETIKATQPGGVQDRVKKWQTANAAGIDGDDSDPEPTTHPEIIVEYEESSAGEELRKRVKYRRQRATRTETKEDVEDIIVQERSKSTPRRRVTSDEHWMKDRSNTIKINKSATTLPKNFVKDNGTNPPLKRKIQDWVTMVEGSGPESGGPESLLTSVERPSESIAGDGIRVYPSRSASPEDEAKARQSGSASKPRASRSKSASYEGIPTDSARWDKPVQKRSQAWRPENKSSELIVPLENTRSVGKHGKGDSKINRLSAREATEIRIQSTQRASTQSPPHDIQVRNLSRGAGKIRLEPSHPAKGKSQQQSSYETSLNGDGEDMNKDICGNDERPCTPVSLPDSLEDVPFGNSAFSVVDIPLGADAYTMRKTMRKGSKPQRAPSFRVPNVLKKVYTEGMKIMHDTVEPPTVGVNQPPSIENWLNSTTDPFVDRPITQSSRREEPGEPRRMPSYKEDDQTERELTANCDAIHERSVRKRSKDMASPLDAKQKEISEQPKRVSSQSREESHESRTASLSPTGLKRSPATRVSSPPTKSTRKVPLKEALMDAFRGESTTTRPKSTSFPLADIARRRETETQAIPDVQVSDFDENAAADSHAKRRRDLPRSSGSDESTKKSKPLPSPPTQGRRLPPTTGIHCLSTIASVETFSSVSATQESASQVTQTTVTQDTELSGSPSERSALSRRKHSRSGSKKRLTKHSDLVSVLSLPDSAPPGRATSIRSARSVRTTRRRLERATIEDVMLEVGDDESKYMRELKTLVEGVIPVLLTSVLSRSKEAEAAGLFNPDSDDGSEKALTQPIVDMGVSLERLKSLHKRIPSKDPDAFIAWAHRAHKTYSDYLRAWRLGFEDVIVNLAPASRSPTPDQGPILEDVPRNEQGDVVDTNGERVDVAFLLKRPMARIKYLAKATNGIAKLKPSNLADKIAATYDDLLEQARRRTREEEANLEDRLASNIDPTRARDPRTMALVQDVKIDPSLKVMAKDYFSLMYRSAGGQRIECRVELFLRSTEGDAMKGDLLICYVDDFSRYLLFPPITKNRISARLDEFLTVVIRSSSAEKSAATWQEELELEAEVYNAATEWADMLGVTPFMAPPATAQTKFTLPPQGFSNLNPQERETRSDKEHEAPANDIEIPIGARRRRATRLATNPLTQRAKNDPSSIPTASKKRLVEPDNQDQGIVSSTKSSRNGLKAAENTPPPPPPPHSRSRYHSPERRSPGRTSPMVTQKASPAKSPSSEFQTPLHPVTFSTKTTNNADVAHLPSKGRPPSPLQATDEIEAPPPPLPVHKTPTEQFKSPYLETPKPKIRHRRTSSPLKHEYQPSDASGTSSDSESEISSIDGHATSEDSSDEELEAADIPNPIPSVLNVYTRQLPRSESLYSLPNATLAPSNSASHAPYRGVPYQRDSEQTKRIIATISSWSDTRGRWEDLWDGACSVVISPGLIEAFEMGATHSSPNLNGMLVSSGISEVATRPDAGAEPPIIGQVLTPCVPLRQSTMIDIEIKSPPTSNSKVKSSSSVRYRALNTIACGEMYQAIHQARLDNIVYRRLEAERTLAGYGSNPYERVVHRRSWFFGRRKSYRAPAQDSSVPRTHSADASDDERLNDATSGSISTSAPSFLKRFSRGSFNIARSSVARNSTGSEFVSGSGSLYTSSSSGGITPPRTPSTPSISLSGTQNSRWSFSGSTPVDLGTSNLKIRLYCLETASKWNDTGAARLTVTAPPAGMRAEYSLYHGIERRVLVTRHTIDVSKLPDHSIQGTKDDVVFDRILGGGCFSKIGRTGICVNVWEDVRGPNGEVGMVGKVGGVSGTTRKWCFQTACSYDANWIYNLVAVGR